MFGLSMLGTMSGLKQIILSLFIPIPNQTNLLEIQMLAGIGGDTLVLTMFSNLVFK